MMKSKVTVNTLGQISRSGTMAIGKTGSDAVTGHLPTQMVVGTRALSKIISGKVLVLLHFQMEATTWELG